MISNSQLKCSSELDQSYSKLPSTLPEADLDISITGGGGSFLFVLFFFVFFVFFLKRISKQFALRKIKRNSCENYKTW